MPNRLKVTGWRSQLSPECPVAERLPGSLPRRRFWVRPANRKFGTMEEALMPRPPSRFRRFPVPPPALSQRVIPFGIIRN